MRLVFPPVATGFKFEELGTEGLNNSSIIPEVGGKGRTFPLRFYILLLVVLSVISDSFQGFSDCASGDLYSELFPAKSRMNRI